ncbi:MAG: hypothetical protein J4F43_03230 [Dehalococcoidia bacterium]|nr:hypothetical protein [Dehalococcoidia bacterium]
MFPKLYECGQCGFASAWQSTLENHFANTGHVADSDDYYRARRGTQAVARLLWGAAILGVGWWWWVRDFSGDNAAVSLPIFLAASALLVFWMLRPRRSKNVPKDPE